MRKSLRIAFFGALMAFSGPKWAFADQITSAKFRGLNNQANSVLIDPSEAQDLLNVDVSITGQSFKKRSGYGTYKALSTSKALHGGYHAFDSSGNDYQLWGSSTSLYGIVADATPIQLVSSATLSSTWDCADTQQNSYCVDSNRDAYIRTNGTTMTWFTSPLGTMVESTPDRIVVAGVSGSPNTLFVSQSNTFTNFTVGVNATDAFNEVIAAPGSKITNIRWGCGKLLWWKDQSFGYFDFDDQFAAQVKTVSDVIGTFDNTSAIDPGGRVWFRGQDGHTWMYDCSILTKQTVPITPDIQLAGKRTSNLWTQTSNSDFSSGLTSSVTISNNSVNVSTDNTLNWNERSFENGSSWAQSSSICTIRSGLNTPSCGTISPLDASSMGECTGANGSVLSYAQLIDLNSNVLDQVALPVLSNCIWSTGTIVASSSLGKRAYLRFLTGTDYVVSTAAFIIGGNITFHYSGNLFASGAYAMEIDSITTGGVSSISSGVYTSSVHNAPNITGWSTLNLSNNDTGGTHALMMRSSTNSFTVSSSTPTWLTVTSGGLISISTGTYFQLKDTMTVTSSSNKVPGFDDFTINWFEGTAADQAYMIYFDNAIWETIAFGSGQSTNNYIFKYDLLNEGWTLYNFGAGGMLVQANTLYFGDTSTGSNVFNYGGATSDNGTAINAFWKSKDYTGNDPFLQNQLTNIDTFAKKNQGTTLTATYVMDTSTTTTYSISMSDSLRSIVQSRKLLPSGKLGQVFNIQYGDTSASSAWEILGYRIGFMQLPYRPTSP